MTHGTSGAYPHHHEAYQVCSFPDEDGMAVLCPRVKDNLYNHG